MKQSPYFVILALVLGQSLLGSFMMAAQQAELSVVRSSTASKDAFQLVVVAKSLDSLGAGQLDLVFDSDHLEFQDAFAGDLLSSALFESNLVESNRVRIAFASSEPVSGEGALLLVNFTPRGSPVESLDFDLESVSVWKSSDSTELGIQAVGGTVSWNEASTSQPLSTAERTKSPDTSLPGWVYFVGGAGLSLIIVLLILVLRGRK